MAGSDDVGRRETLHLGSALYLSRHLSKICSLLLDTMLVLHARTNGRQRAFNGNHPWQSNLTTLLSVRALRVA